MAEIIQKITGRNRRLHESNLTSRESHEAKLAEERRIDPRVAKYVSRHLPVTYKYLRMEFDGRLLNPDSPIMPGSVVATLNEEKRHTDASILGVFQGLVRDFDGRVFAAIDTGVGIHYEDPHFIGRVVKDISDLFAPKWQRNVGRRVMKKARECGAPCGEELTFFVALSKACERLRKQRAELTGGAYQPLQTATDLERLGRFSGEICTEFFIRSGVAPGSITAHVMDLAIEFYECGIFFEGFSKGYQEGIA